MKTCIVISRERREFFSTPEPDPSGLALALFALREAHEVTILFADKESRTPPEMLADWRRHGLTVCSLFEEERKEKSSEPFYPELLQKSWLVYRWLKARSFDLVFFQDDSSASLLSMQARKLGEAFPATRLIYRLHGPPQWTSHLRDRRQLVRVDLALAYSVQYAVENADQLILPVGYFQDRIIASGWRPTENVSVLPSIPAPPENENDLLLPGAVRRLLYPVHHSDHAGLAIFLEALLTVRSACDGMHLTFLCYGSTKEQHDFSKRVRALLGAQIDHLACDFVSAEVPFPRWKESCLWIFSPYWLDLPGVMLEAADRGEQMLVASTPESRSVPALAACTVSWQSIPLGARLQSCWQGAEIPRAVKQSRTESEKAWRTQVFSEPSKPAPSFAHTEMRVTVCVAHFNKAAYLEEALESLRKQTYRNLEVIVVDDASTDPASREVFQKASSRYSSSDWKFVSQLENRGPGYVRNLAAQMATGDYLLFFDADDVAFPEMTERLLTALNRPGIDCVAGSSRRLRNVNGRRELKGISTYVGGSLENAFLHPPAGTVFIIGKKVFSAVGGFESKQGQDCHEDWNFHLRLLAQEYRLHVLPEPVFAYRAAPQSRSLLVTRNMMNNLEPLLHATPRMQKNLLLFALDRAGAVDSAAGTLAEYVHLARGIRFLRRLERWRRRARRLLGWSRKDE